MMGAEQIGIVLLGALAGGFVSGLSGFGTGITALGIWLFALEPAVAATLVVICSVTSQLQTFPAIRHEIDAKRVLPFIIPGLLGVPVGAALLSHLDARTLKAIVGVFLIVFPTYMLVLRNPRPIAAGGRVADGIIGLAGGVLGGLAGLSGPLPTMWATLRGWSKATSRSVFQAYNLSILLAALTVHALSGFVTGQVLWAALAALPGTIIGSLLGTRVYARMSDSRFRAVILILLAASGVMLVVSNVGAGR